MEPLHSRHINQGQGISTNNHGNSNQGMDAHIDWLDLVLDDEDDIETTFQMLFSEASSSAVSSVAPSSAAPTSSVPQVQLNPISHPG